jgi:mRNA interferase MazF
MTSYDFGDIVLVPFPFTDQSGIKKRPAVVVSSAAYNTARLDLILMAVTSQVRPVTTFGEVLISDWQKAGAVEAFRRQARDDHGREAAHHPSTRTP